ncbi:hypothetical protein D5E87_25770 [Vibrio parahaemolyticus]|uniref:hypothetical protein n=1 Tax=Vibrio parahaemolyticus TaxID=670 RepID=UPI0010371FE5|nr:hypothetical protein [Vibrio parahaemolyticus]TBT01221.1 hypothetical protein D5E87_25770 [Vibrio parahaemolyticus]TOK03505.1 hypothetical protein CGI25_24920 [Vibrio parahaemolyticus]HCH1224688.1 hypothetical protein [Vibrio parahaemolyticus]
MNVYITAQFNKAINNLNEVDQKKVFNAYKRLSSISLAELVNSKSFVKLQNSKEKIFVYRASPNLRIFCSFEHHNGESGLLFLDVIDKKSANHKYPF